MAGNLYPVNGCKIFIGGAKEDQTADFVAGDFTSETWVQIGAWTQMGSFGDAANLITSDRISESRTKKAKGTRNAGSMQNTFDSVPTDLGQLALIAAEKTLNNYAFKVELNDKPVTGVAPTNSLRYFIGLVMSANEQGGGANTPQTMNASIEINSNIVRVAATTGA